MSKVTSNVPRGFTRFYVLYLLSERHMTGKKIIDESVKRSEGEWAPSPGLIYPLLGRLVRDGLISEPEDSAQAREAVSRLVDSAKSQAKLPDTSIDPPRCATHNLPMKFNRLGVSMYAAGKFIAEETIDRICIVTASFKDRISKKSGDAQKRFDEMYEEFLLSELERLKNKETPQQG